MINCVYYVDLLYYIYIKYNTKVNSNHVFAFVKEFELERKFLWHEVFPDLQQHCLQYGADLAFVDMLLGNGAPDVSRDLEERKREIEMCRKQSAGPFFLVRIQTIMYAVVRSKCVIGKYISKHRRL